jgi:hypothetical protein
MGGGFRWEGSCKDAKTQRMDGEEDKDKEEEWESWRVRQNAGFG